MSNPNTNIPKPATNKVIFRGPNYGRWLVYVENTLQSEECSHVVSAQISARLKQQTQATLFVAAGMQSKEQIDARKHAYKLLKQLHERNAVALPSFAKWYLQGTDGINGKTVRLDNDKRTELSLIGIIIHMQPNSNGDKLVVKLSEKDPNLPGSATPHTNKQSQILVKFYKTPEVGKKNQSNFSVNMFGANDVFEGPTYFLNHSCRSNVICSQMPGKVFRFQAICNIVVGEKAQYQLS
ncbi:hypothetical protein MP228_007091 [Amoeboaphelidium protococcarum]|nr:hypothetical protein MP228_007091 [Amoeboaphelidium protococcarum]